jgi:TM2 domain-containing membrane protein YozV
MLCVCELCHSNATGNPVRARFCTSCGYLLPESEVCWRAQRKSPWLAALLSFVLVGMGQIYIGQIEKGVTMIVIVLSLTIAVAPGPWGIVIVFFNVLDAFVLAQRSNKGRELGRWQFFFQV